MTRKTLVCRLEVRDACITSGDGAVIGCEPVITAAADTRVACWLFRVFSSLDSAESFLAGTREERTEVFCFCTLFGFLVAFFLLSFFDGDTDDLYCGSIAIIWIARRNRHKHIQPFNDLTEDAVTII